MTTPIAVGLVDATVRRAVAAAVRTDDGVIHFFPAPCRHHHTVHALHRARPAEDESGLIVARGEQGFVMSDGCTARICGDAEPRELNGVRSTSG